MTEEKSQTDIDNIRERVRELCNQKNYSEALEVAKVLLSPDSSDRQQAEGLWMHAYVMEMQGKVSEAIRYRYQAKAKNPTDTGIEHSLMRNLIECRRFAEAIESAERLIALDRDTEWQPFTGSAHFHKAYALYKLGQLDEAIREFSLVEDMGNVWIDRHLTTKALLLDEIAKARRQK
jgi:tetratricopeptide (TPR) repeat protein